MPLSNLPLFEKLQHAFSKATLRLPTFGLQPCLFCQTSRAKQHGVCYQCWQTLPWKQQLIERHEVSCWVACEYRFPMNRILHAYKDQAQLQYVDLLVACLLTMPKPRVQAIVPMPISTEKLIFRGFNQSELLAQALSTAWQLPIWRPISRESGISQRGADRSERLVHAEAQMMLNTTEKRYNSVLVLDDVITTGASVLAVKNLLNELGCSNVQVACLCDARH